LAKESTDILETSIINPCLVSAAYQQSHQQKSHHGVEFPSGHLLNALDIDKVSHWSCKCHGYKVHQGKSLCSTQIGLALCISAQIG
jgi:hypothetical protein